MGNSDHGTTDMREGEVSLAKRYRKSSPCEVDSRKSSTFGVLGRVQHALLQGYLAHKKHPPPRTLQ